MKVIDLLISIGLVRESVDSKELAEELFYEYHCPACKEERCEADDCFTCWTQYLESEVITNDH